MSIWTIVVAAGAGERFGQRKQYLPLAGRRMLDWSLSTARLMTDGVVVVVPLDVADDAEPLADRVVAGGATRSASVREGLAVLPAGTDLVLVHDAARPVPVLPVWERVLTALAEGADAVVPVVPVTDTLRSRDHQTVDRTQFAAVQTPQGFRVDVLRAAHREGADATDDAALVEAAGGRVVEVDGDPTNIKVTGAVDLQLAELLCS